MKDLYFILGVDVNSTLIEIKEAYRKLSKKFHPDLNQNDKYFENRFREVQEAYDILSDPVKRLQYDAALKKVKAAQRANDNPTYYYTEQAGGYSAKSRSKTRGIDIGFTIVLFIITLVFGNYVIKAVMNSKASHMRNPTVVNAVSFKTPPHHKKKHNLKLNTVNAYTKIRSDSINSIIKQPAPVIPKATTPVASFLYATSIRSNATGVTNMRELDNYNSPVIAEIPTNSKVFVVEKGDTFYKIRFNSVVGYVPKWTLQEK